MVSVGIGFRVAVVLLAARVAAAAPLEVRVTLLDEERLPRMTNAQLGKVLDVARRMLEKGCGAEVVFRVGDRVPVGQFLEGERWRVAPYERPKDSYNDIFEIERLELDAAARAGCELYGTVEELKAVFEPAEREGITSHAAAARLLVRKYKQRIADIRREKDAAGKPLITRDNWRDFSIAHWEVYFASMPWGETRRLYLANTILVDDLRAFAPHSMISGIANGVAYPGVNAAIVAYHPILSGEESLRTHRLGDLTEDERLAVMAYVVAHEVGAHLIRHDRDDYREGTGLARPIAAFADKRELLDVERWGERKVEPRRLDVEMIKWWMCDLRIDVCIARNDSFGALDVLELASKLNIEVRRKADLDRKVRTAWREE